MRIIQTSVDVIVKVRSYGQYSREDIDQKKSIYKRIINFAICNSCYWSASCLKLDRFIVTCPTCGDDRLEFMPLSETEAYTFDRDAKRGIILKFYNGSDKPQENLHS